MDHGALEWLGSTFPTLDRCPNGSSPIVCKGEVSHFDSGRASAKTEAAM